MDKRKWKGIQQDWNVVQAFDNTTDKFTCLTQRDQNVIIQALTPLRWATRWTNLPSPDDLDYIDQLIGKIMCNQECCDAVLECVDTTPGRDLIREIVIETIDGETGGNGVYGEGNPIFNGCDKDIIFGATTALVDYVNSTIIDVFEIIEVSTNFIEAINLWADNIDILGSLPSFILEALNWIQDNIQQNYEANFTVNLRDTYRCDLLCLWVENDCQLTSRMVFEYYLLRIGSVSVFSTFADTVTFLVAGVWSGSQIVDAMFAMVFGSIAVDDAVGFFDIKGLYSFNTIVAVGANSPDPDWLLLCDPCAEPQYCYTWLGGDGFIPAWTINTFIGGTASYDAFDDRLVGGKSPTPDTGAIIDISYDTLGTDITEIEVIVTWLATRITGTDGIYFIVDGIQQQFNSIGTSGTDQTFTYTPVTPLTGSIIKIQAVSAGNTAGDSAFIWMTKLTVNGEGINPFGASNC